MPISEAYYLFYFYQITQEKQEFKTLYNLANSVKHIGNIDSFLFPYRINKLTSLDKLQHTLRFYDFIFSEKEPFLNIIKYFLPATMESKEIIDIINKDFFDAEFLERYFNSDWPDCSVIIVDEVLSWYLARPQNSKAILSKLRTDLLNAFSTSFYDIISPKVEVQLIEDLRANDFEIEKTEKPLLQRLFQNPFFKNYYYWSPYPLSMIYSGTRVHNKILKNYQENLWKKSI